MYDFVTRKEKNIVFLRPIDKIVRHTGSRVLVSLTETRSLHTGTADTLVETALCLRRDPKHRLPL